MSILRFQTVNSRPETITKSKVCNQLLQDLKAFSMGFSLDQVESIEKV